jgi:hypothetical protein
LALPLSSQARGVEQTSLEPNDYAPLSSMASWETATGAAVGDPDDGGPQKTVGAMPSSERSGRRSRGQTRRLGSTRSAAGTGFTPTDAYRLAKGRGLFERALGAYRAGRTAEALADVMLAAVYEPRNPAYKKAVSLWTTRAAEDHESRADGEREQTSRVARERAPLPLRPAKRRHRA